MHVGEFMKISAVPGNVPAVQPQQVAAAQKPATPQAVAPVAAGDADGDHDGSSGAATKGIIA